MTVLIGSWLNVALLCFFCFLMQVFQSAIMEARRFKASGGDVLSDMLELLGDSVRYEPSRLFVCLSCAPCLLASSSSTWNVFSSSFFRWCCLQKIKFDDDDEQSKEQEK